MTELLPCPFCGGPALFEYVRSGGTMSSGMEPPTCYAGCKKCGVRFSGGETQGWDSTRRWYDRLEEAHDKAAESWNHRHSAEIAGALRDAEGWQPIESAPKDGTKVLLYHHGYKSAFYSRDHEPRVWVDVFREGNWYNTAPSAQPTHWRHLPAPPTQDSAMQQGGGGG